MPELNFNLLNPSAELYSGPQVKLDPEAAYEAAQAQQQSNMLSQLYAKHYNPQTGGINYNSLIGEAAQNPLTANAMPILMKGAQEQAKAQADLLQTQAQRKQSEATAEAKQQELRQAKIKEMAGDSYDRLQSVKTPEDFMAWHLANPELEGTNKAERTAKLQAQLAQSGGFEAALKDSTSSLQRILGIEAKDITPKPTQVDVGGSIKTIDMNPRSDTYLKEIRTYVKTATPGQVMTNERLTSNLNRTALNLTPDQSDALTAVIAAGNLDPSKVTSRNASILANVALKNPNTDFNQLIGNAAMLRNVAYQQKAQMALALPTVLTNLENSGKKLNYSDNKWVAGLEAWGKGVNQDPQLVDYMTQRNDAILSIAAVARGVGMSDFATKLENEISSPHMSPKALESYIAAQRKSLEPRLAEYRAHSLTSGTTPPPAAENTAASQTPPAASSVSVKTPTQAGIDYLLKNPSKAAQFDEMFGAGEAAKYLKKGK